MHLRNAAFFMGLLFSAATFAQSIVTPVFVHKDGDASAADYGGSAKDIYVDGGTNQSIGWIALQTQGIDFSKITSGKLQLYIKSVTSPGTLQARLLTADIIAPENNVPLVSIPAATTVTATSSLGSADIEKMLQIDLTAALKGGSFKGVALTSEDGLSAAFDSKEGRLAPVLLLTYNITTSWSDSLGSVSTPNHVAIGTTPTTDALAVNGTVSINGPVKISGRANGVTFPDNSTQTTAFAPGSYTTTAQLRDSLAAVRTQMNARIAALESLLVYFSRNGTDIYITGANLNIRNGTGSTATANGQGNLIVGYNEPPTTGTKNKNGSHNIVGGKGNNYSSYGGLVVGYENTISGAYSSVSGGWVDTAKGFASSVSGGMRNVARDSVASVSGGWGNTADTTYSSVSGGALNHARGSFSSVSGGNNNIASGWGSSISGGAENGASGWVTSINGGYGNKTYGNFSSVSGGMSNTASGSYSSVGGGESNTASGMYSSVTAGSFNTALGSHSGVSGGRANFTRDTAASISGGYSNTADSAFSSVSGGWANTAKGKLSSVGGGFSNTANGYVATISGGQLNIASGYISTANGGYRDTASGRFSSVSGGQNNIASQDYSSVAGGEGVNASVYSRMAAQGTVTGP